MREIVGAVHDASLQTGRIEQRAMSLLFERGSMRGLTHDQEREVEELVRQEIVANYQ